MTSSFLLHHRLDSHRRCPQLSNLGRVAHGLCTKDLRASWPLAAACARPSDARIATTASLFIGVLFCCAQRLQISRTLAELHWIRRRRPTTALLPASALPKVSAGPSDAGPSDAGPAITASRFAGVLLGCARCERAKRNNTCVRAEVNTYNSRAGV